MTTIPEIIKNHTDTAGTITDKDALLAKLQEHLDQSTSTARKEGEKSTSALSSWFSGESKAAQDPVEVMRDVFKDDAFDADEKKLLFYMSRERFQNRRKMAYVALTVLTIGGIAAIGAIIYDGAIAQPNFCLKDDGTVITNCTLEQVNFRLTHAIKENETILTWLGSFFTGIIAFYFGASSFRPTS